MRIHYYKFIHFYPRGSTAKMLHGTNCRYRMGLRPYRDENTKLLQGKTKSVSKVEAVTEYKVLLVVIQFSFINSGCQLKPFKPFF